MLCTYSMDFSSSSCYLIRPSSFISGKMSFITVLGNSVFDPTCGIVLNRSLIVCEKRITCNNEISVYETETISNALCHLSSYQNIFIRRLNRTNISFICLGRMTKISFLSAFHTDSSITSAGFGDDHVHGCKPAERYSTWSCRRRYQTHHYSSSLLYCLVLDKVILHHLILGSSMTRTAAYHVAAAR